MKNKILLNIPLALLLASPLSYALPRCPEKIDLAYYEFGLLFHDGKGIDKSIVDELARRSHCTFQTSVRPRAKIWQSIQDGTLMMSVSGIQTPERDQFAYFSVPYVNTKNMVVLSPAIAEKHSTFADFLANPALRFGAVKSFKHGEKQDQILDQLRTLNRVDEAQDSRQLLEWLRDGKIQGAFSEATSYTVYFRELKFKIRPAIRDWAPEDRGVPAGLIFSKRHFNEQDVAEWDLLLQAIRQDGTLARILGAYLPEFEIPRAMAVPRTADQGNSKKTAK
ncbi:substrate-binding periplasmic protein [Chitinibacter sp. S2-10]|uniref:substrate-binding periplasmic protein n=1 Tax=Chitinibacter sp. S2-10 TaxID=3373597 RepID=UPI0039777403